MKYLIYLLIMVSASLNAGEIHKWADEDGNIYYGDAPPIEAETERVKVLRAPSNPGKALPRLSSSNPGTESNPGGGGEAASNDPAGDIPEDQAIIACEQAQSDLSVIKRSSRIRLRAADGSLRYMSTEEIDARKQSAEEDVARFCK